MANKCKECGCQCKECLNPDHDVHLHVEIENLQQKLLERENHIVNMETNFLNEANKFPNGENAALREELLTWQDKYRRLYEAHRRVQRVNQGLEDKLLKLVDVCETDKNTLTKDVAILSHKLAEANYIVKKLTTDNERYKNDVSLAIQFLQCKKSHFVAHKFETLPGEVQNQVASFMTNKPKSEPPARISYEMKSIKVPIPTFPPTAMVYSVPKSPNLNRRIEDPAPELPSVDIVSAAIMAKVLEERQKDRAFAKHCDSCTCAKKLKIIYDITHHSVGTQTGGEYKPNLCIKCNDYVTEASQRLVLIKSQEETAQIAPQTVVKVQPNNFLSNSQIGAPSSAGLINNVQIVAPSSSRGGNIVHHHLCSNNNINNSKSEGGEESSAKNGSSGDAKGPRFCSMRLQSGTRNILLDNAHNVTPVLYTDTRHNLKIMPEKRNNLSESVSEHALKSGSVFSENSAENQQRVAEWIQHNLEITEVSSSDNSQRSGLVAQVAKSGSNVKYAEMEENVKRFLFGESEFLKTVEIGKLKYKNYKEELVETASNSHTETKI